MTTLRMFGYQFYIYISFRDNGGWSPCRLTVRPQQRAKLFSETIKVRLATNKLSDDGRAYHRNNEHNLGVNLLRRKYIMWYLNHFVYCSVYIALIARLYSPMGKNECWVHHA